MPAPIHTMLEGPHELIKGWDLEIMRYLTTSCSSVGVSVWSAAEERDFRLIDFHLG